jgi:hypothetical protein
MPAKMKPAMTNVRFGREGEGNEIHDDEAERN